MVGPFSALKMSNSDTINGRAIVLKTSFYFFILRFVYFPLYFHRKWSRTFSGGCSPFQPVSPSTARTTMTVRRRRPLCNLSPPRVNLILWPLLTQCWRSAGRVLRRQVQRGNWSTTCRKTLSMTRPGLEVTTITKAWSQRQHPLVTAAAEAAAAWKTL